MSIAIYCFLFAILSWKLSIASFYIMKLESNFNTYINDNMIHNQITSANLSASINNYSKQPIYKNTTSTLLMPFDTPPLANQLKQHQQQQQNLNYSNLNKNKQISQKNEDKIESDDLNESDDDDEEFLYVTFDLNGKSDNILKNLSQDTLKRLNELGILSIQVDNDKPINTKLKTSNNNQIVTVNSFNELKHEKMSVPTPNNTSNLSIPSPSPTSPFLINQSPQKVLINNPVLPASLSPVLPPPPARKRNRKTINELTNHLSSNNSFTNYPPNDITNRSDEVTIKTENSITNKSTGQVKRKRTNKSNDNSLDSSTNDDTNNEKSSQMKSNLSSDIKQVYIIDKHQSSIGTSSIEQNQSFSVQNNSSFIAPFHSNSNNNNNSSDLVNISSVNNSNNTNNNTIVNYSDHNNFKDNQQQPAPQMAPSHQIQQIQQHQDPNHKQQYQMVQQLNHQPQHYQIINPQQQHQSIQYQQHMFNNNQQKINQQQTSQQYRMPSPMLANILSSNEISNSYSSQLNVSQIKNSHETYLINNNNNNLINHRENNVINKDNFNENHTNYNNDNNNKQSLNELQLLKSEDYKQIYQMRQMLIANQQQQKQIQQSQHHQLQNQQLQQQQIQQNLQHQSQPIQQETYTQNQSANTTAATSTTKRRRAPADPSKIRTKRTKTIAPNPQTTPQTTSNTNLNNLIILSSSDMSKQTDTNQSQVITIHSTGDDKSNLSTNIMDPKIRNYESFINQSPLEPGITNNNNNNNTEKFLNFSITNETKDKNLSGNNIVSVQDNKTKLESEENISKISLQVIDPSNLYSQNQQSNLIYLNPTTSGPNTENINKIKSLNFVSFKLNNSNNNNNTGPVSSAYSSSSSSTITQPSSYLIANKQQPQNLILSNTNNYTTANCVSSSSTASSSISCFNNNYEFVNTTKSSSPIKELTSIVSSNCNIQSNNTLQSINFIKTNEETKQNQ